MPRRGPTALARVGIQKNIIDFRGQLRMAMLDNKPAAEQFTHITRLYLDGLR